MREGALAELDEAEPFVVAIDDSHLEKTGKKTQGVGWRRDSHTPPFITNFIRAQRTLQISAALPAGSGPAGARMVPIDFVHAPTATKPRKGASPEVWDTYKAECKLKNIGRVGAKRLENLRTALDLKEGSKRYLIVTADGRFTNGTFLKALPEKTTLIGRVRKDACLHFTPEEGSASVRGRKPSYGEKAPTPEELRQDKSVPWQTIPVWAAGKVHKCRVKTLVPCAGALPGLPTI